MRPPVLYPIFAELTSLPGFGAKLAKLAEKLVGGNTLWALLQHVPSGLIDRRYNPSIAEAEPGRIATLIVTPIEHRPPGRLSKAPYRVAAVDEDGSQIEVIFFRASTKWMTERMPTGKQVVISGKVDAYRGAKQMAHPELILPIEKLDEALRCEPTYPLTQGLVPARLRGGLEAALQKLPDLPEWADKHLVEQRGWPEWKQAVTSIHSPNGPADLSPTSKARTRLAYDELLAGQLGLLLVRRANLRKGGRAFIGDGVLRKAVEDGLPFTLTGAQMQALSEIYADMQDDTRMMRLLQGDVGSGKTVVALLAAALAVEAGAQAAIMAPTEILARQHFDSIAPMALKAGLRCVVLTGRDKGKTRREILAQIAEG
ncbi:MAG: hypothetical protein Alpg2KO_27720 [Alphaproteobacteria bacterium]